VVFITAISAYTIALAGESEAFKISGEVYGNATRRLGYQVSKSFDEVNKSNADKLPAVLKRAAGKLKGVALGEEMVIKSVSELAPSSARLKELLGQEAKSLRDLAEVQINSLIRTAGYLADDFSIPKPTFNLTPEEKNAAGIIPSLIADIRDLGYRGYNDSVNKLPSDVRNKYKVMDIADISEACKLINGSNSILDIKYIIDSQENTETSVNGLLNYFSLLKEAGIIKF
jgi:hypothetical protein